MRDIALSWSPEDNRSASLRSEVACYRGVRAAGSVHRCSLSRRSRLPRAGKEARQGWPHPPIGRTAGRRRHSTRSTYYSDDVPCFAVGVLSEKLLDREQDARRRAWHGWARHSLFDREVWRASRGEGPRGDGHRLSRLGSERRVRHAGRRTCKHDDDDVRFTRTKADVVIKRTRLIR